MIWVVCLHLMGMFLYLQSRNDSGHQTSTSDENQLEDEQGESSAAGVNDEESRSRKVSGLEKRLDGMHVDGEGECFYIAVPSRCSRCAPSGYLLWARSESACL